jgi:hypothetical protein
MLTFLRTRGAYDRVSLRNGAVKCGHAAPITESGCRILYRQTKNRWELKRVLSEKTAPSSSPHLPGENSCEREKG